MVRGIHSSNAPCGSAAVNVLYRIRAYRVTPGMWFMPTPLTEMWFRSTTMSSVDEVSRMPWATRKSGHWPYRPTRSHSRRQLRTTGLRHTPPAGSATSTTAVMRDEWVASSVRFSAAASDCSHTMHGRSTYIFSMTQSTPQPRGL